MVIDRGTAISVKLRINLTETISVSDSISVKQTIPEPKFKAITSNGKGWVESSVELKAILSDGKGYIEDVPRKPSVVLTESKVFTE